MFSTRVSAQFGRTDQKISRLVDYRESSEFDLAVSLDSSHIRRVDAVMDDIRRRKQRFQRESMWRVNANAGKLYENQPNPWLVR